MLPDQFMQGGANSAADLGVRFERRLTCRRHVAGFYAAVDIIKNPEGVRLNLSVGKFERTQIVNLSYNVIRPKVV